MIYIIWAIIILACVGLVYAPTREISLTFLGTVSRAVVTFVKAIYSLLRRKGK